MHWTFKLGTDIIKSIKWALQAPSKVVSGRLNEGLAYLDDPVEELVSNLDSSTADRQIFRPNTQQNLIDCLINSLLSMNRTKSD